jgi:hypothetical protein
VEPEDSLPCSQEPTIGPCLSHMDPVHIPNPFFFKIHLNVSHRTTFQDRTLNEVSGAFSFEVRTAHVHSIDRKFEVRTVVPYYAVSFT